MDTWEITYTVRVQVQADSPDVAEVLADEQMDAALNNGLVICEFGVDTDSDAVYNVTTEETRGGWEISQEEAQDQSAIASSGLNR